MYKAKKNNNKVKLLNMLYVLPMVAVFAVLIVYPVMQVLKQSFSENLINGNLIFVGLGNFKAFFANPDSLLILKNTFIWVFVGVFAKLLLGLIMALILYNKFFGKQLLVAIMLIPYAMPTAVACVIWRLMYNPIFGQIGQFLNYIGIIHQPIHFLGNISTSLLAVMIVNVWAVAPFCALCILSMLYSIPGQIYEAAKTDGTTGVQRFFYITLPLISSSLRTLGLLIGIWAFNSFDVIFMMTEGGPANSSEILVNDVYQNAFVFNNRGYSAAISVISFIILTIFAVIYLRSQEDDVSYE
jgi:ABC-type sugar transport system permease subunit